MSDKMPRLRALARLGTIPPDDTVNLVFNLSRGEDARGPWNEAPFEYIADPQPQGGMPPAPINPDDEKPAAMADAKAKRPTSRK
jgi:Mn-containing catalase